MTTKITPSVLANTAVSAGSYGSATEMSVVTIDAQGRITAASAAAASLSTTQITSGTFADARLPDKVTATSAGSATQVSRFTVDAKGRITSANSVAIAIPKSQITDFPTLVTSATTDTTSATNITSGTLPDARLSSTGVSAASYGRTSYAISLTVDAKGRLTSVNSGPIAITSAAVSGLSPSATTDTTDAGNISTGTLSASRLPASGVVAQSYGGQASVPRFTIDAAGRITRANNIAIGISAGAVTGLSGVATSGSYFDLSNKPTILSRVETLEAAYPVGTIYLNTSNPETPNTLLGIGTWQAVSNSNFTPSISPLYVWKRTS
jgi:hypothetical protein